MIELDGSYGEGGGQIIRTALTLSLATGRAFRISDIRAGRERPGLRRQHLIAVQAAAELGRADVRGAALHSRELTFRPGKVRPGEYRFAIGTAGSTMLVLQTVLPVLLTADAPSMLVLEGGTHNIHAPPFDYIEMTWLPLVNRMGPHVEAVLERPGFYPAGGGLVRLSVRPCAHLGRLELLERGPVREVRARAVVSRLPRHIAERELKAVADELSLTPRHLEAVEETRAAGPGNIVLIEIESEHLTEVFSACGQVGVRAEQVGRQAAREAAEYLAADVPVGPHLADQLLLPLALGEGGSYRTGPLTEHTRTHIDVIRRFLKVRVDADPMEDGTVRITVETGLSETAAGQSGS